MSNYKFLVWFVLLSSVSLAAQPFNVDSLKVLFEHETDNLEKARHAQELTNSYLYLNADSAEHYARRSLELTTPESDPLLHGDGMSKLCQSFLVLGKAQELKDSSKAFIPYYIEHEMHNLVAVAYRNIAVAEDYLNRPDSTIHYTNLCEGYLNEHPDSTILALVSLTKSIGYQRKGFNELAIQASLKAARIYEDLGDIGGVGYSYQNVSIIYSSTERNEDAIVWEQKALENFELSNDLRSTAYSVNNIGYYNAQLDRLNIAKPLCKRAYTLSMEQSQFIPALFSSFHLAEIYFKEGNRDSMNLWIQRAEPLAQDINNLRFQGELHRLKTKIALQNGQLTIARNHLKLSDATTQGNLVVQDLPDAYKETAELYGKVGNPEVALLYYQKAMVIRDSLYSARQSQQVDELNLIYQTEKKDAEIKLLNKQTELDATRKNALGGGLALVTLLAGSFIYSLIQRK